MTKVLKEIEKHANRDECYSCKQLLKPEFLRPFLDKIHGKE
jgi:hypothetical protein